MQPGDASGMSARHPAGCRERNAAALGEEVPVVLGLVHETCAGRVGGHGHSSSSHMISERFGQEETGRRDRASPETMRVFPCNIRREEGYSLVILEGKEGIPL